MTVKRKAVIYRHGLNKMSKDRNKGRAGYAECSHCHTWRPVVNGMMKSHSQYTTKKNGNLSCPNPAGAISEHVVPIKPHKPCDDVYLRENIRRLRDKDYTLGMIARQAGISTSKARSILDTLADTE